MARSSLLRGTALVGTAAWVVYVLDLLSDAGIGFAALVIALVGAALVAAALLVATLRNGLLHRGWLLSLAWGFLSATVIGCTIVFLTQHTAFNPLLRARFALSRTAFDALARAPAASSAPAWIGWYRIQRVDVLGGEVRLITTGCGVIDQCGFVFLAQAPERTRPKSRIAPLAGSWYLLYDVF